MRVTTHAIRITLSNEPGALARATAAMADLDVNIVDVDVHQLDGLHVVDEVVVWMPADVAPADLRAALLKVGCLQVETVPHSHHTTDAIVRCLDGLARCIPESMHQKEALLAVAAQLMPGAVADIVAPTASEAAATAMERGVPVGSVSRTSPTSWSVVLPYPEDEPAVVIRLRRERLRPSSTEIARVRAFFRVHRMIAGAAAGVRATAQSQLSGTGHVGLNEHRG